MSDHIVKVEEARRTTADDVFEQLRSDIVALRLPPGTRLSEAEVAKTFEVSRQPVREAFIRLANMQLLKVQPQRATVVRRVSRSEILQTRFIRTAVEIEIVHRACAIRNTALAPDFLQNLERQRQAVSAKDSPAFGALDYAFHHLLCKAADCEFAFKTIAENKRYVERLCMIELDSASGKQELYADHLQIFEALQAGDSESCVAVTRLHLSRLDDVLEMAQRQQPDYFED